MPVRKTETRIPAGVAASDLGEAVVATDGRCALVSFLTSPLTAGHQNTYVLFVTDAALAASIQSCEWLFAEDGAFPQTVQTTVGEASYTPANIGNMTIIVRFLDSGGAELGSLTLVQDIGPLNPVDRWKLKDNPVCVRSQRKSSSGHGCAQRNYELRL